MNKDKINAKICDLEAELDKLKKLANEPEKRKLQVGDVIERNGWTLLVDGNGGTTCLTSIATDTHPVGGNMLRDEYLTSSTYLGKFSEVYVKISDVREAIDCKNTVDCTKALRKLNIIKD